MDKQVDGQKDGSYSVKRYYVVIMSSFGSGQQGSVSKCPYMVPLFLCLCLPAQSLLPALRGPVNSPFLTYFLPHLRTKEDGLNHRQDSFHSLSIFAVIQSCCSNYYLNSKGFLLSAAPSGFFSLKYGFIQLPAFTYRGAPHRIACCTFLLLGFSISAQCAALFWRPLTSVWSRGEKEVVYISLQNFFGCLDWSIFPMLLLFFLSKWKMVEMLCKLGHRWTSKEAWQKQVSKEKKR